MQTGKVARYFQYILTRGVSHTLKEKLIAAGGSVWRQLEKLVDPGVQQSFPSHG